MTHEVTTPCPVCGRPFPGLDLIPGRKAPAAVPREVDQLFPLVDVGHNKGLVSRLWLARQRASDLRRVLAELEKINRDAVDLGVFERMVKDLIAELSAMLEAQS